MARRAQTQPRHIPARRGANPGNGAGKRERIVAAALRLFANTPYQAVTMDQVARAAGVAKGTLYLYFTSKQALYLGILSDGLESMARRYQASPDSKGGAAERIRRAIDVSMEFYDGQRDLLRLLAAEEPRMAAARNRLIQDWRERGFRFFASLIDQGVRAGVFARVDSRLATLAILGGIRSVLLHYGTQRECGALSNELGRFMLEGLKARAASLASMEERQ
jgi:TetR/AcrR family transcriptional regulator, fatty acid metabolism regulator protein